MAKKVYRGVAAVVIGLAVSLGAARADTLNDALRDAYVNSDLLEQNRYLLRIQDEGVAQQVAGLRPVVNFIASRRWDRPTDVQTSTVGLTADLLLFDNGGTRLAVEAARESVLAARQQLVGLESNVLLDAVSAYMDVWRDAQVVGVRESNVRVVTQQLRAARDRFEVGEDTRTDVAQAEAQLATARSNLAAARGQLDISRQLFEISVGRAPGALSGPGNTPALPASEADAEALARQNHPAILALQHQVAANQHNLEAARSDYGPTINLQAQTTDTLSGRTTGRADVLTLSLTQPIYRGGRLFALERVALATLSASQSELNQQTRVNLQSVGNAYARLRIASAQIQATDQGIRAAQIAFDGVREEASLGARTTLDVLDAEQDLLDARIARIQAQADLYTASYAVLSAAGLLTVEHLNLDVPSYNPQAYSDAFQNAPARLQSVQGDRLDSLMQRIGRD